MHHIYFENRFIVTCSPAELPAPKQGTRFLKSSPSLNIPSVIKEFCDDTSVSALYIYDDDSETLFRNFCSCFKEIEAGGGVVHNDNGGFLIIRRRGLWDIPKGKREDGEDIKECALREVTEETGIGDLVLEDLITVTHHTYHLDGEFILKHTWWFRMHATASVEPIPQTEEEIEAAMWMPLDEIRRKCTDAYLSIKEVIAYL